MAVTSLKRSGVYSLVKYDSFLAGNPWSDFVLLDTVTVGAGGASSVTFSNIPQYYKHLQVRAVLRPTTATNPPYNTFIRFNSDTGANYARHLLRGDGATATSASAASTTSGLTAYSLASSDIANAFATFVTDVLDYSSASKYKTVRTLGGYDVNGAGSAMLTSSLWMATTSISNITFTHESVSNFAATSTFALYGVN